MKKEDIIFKGIIDNDERFGEPYLEFLIPLPLPNNGVYSSIKKVPVHVSIPTIDAEGTYPAISLYELIERGKESVYLNVNKQLGL